MNSGTVKKLLWAVLISTGFMFILLIRVEWEHFALLVGRLDITVLIIACAVFILSNLVRAFRFSKLDHTNEKLIHWWNINAFYNFITSTLPGGVGEAATAYALKRFTMFNILGALRILLLSRLMDLFAISALFFISALLIGSLTSYRETAIWLSGALFFFSLSALIPASERLVMRLLQKLPGHFTLIQRLCERMSELIKIAEEQRNKSLFGVTLFQSVLMVMGAVISIHLVLRSFEADFTLVQSFYCYGIYAVFQIIPVQGIAGIGTKAAWWALALNAAGYRGQDSIAMGFMLYGIFYFFVVCIALLSLLIWLKGRRK
jgi:uncharacterized membrane protein YbhN (UPF0104 family)